MMTRESAAAAALAVIDECGLHELTLQRVADRLGVRTPSLYNHVEDRNELLAEVARLIWSEAEFRELPEIDEISDLKEALVELCASVRSALLRHPAAAPLLFEVLPHYAFTPRYEAWMSLLRATHVPASKHLMIVEGLETLTHGAAFLEAATINAGRDEFPDVDSAVMPHLAEAIATAGPADERFVQTIRTFLDAALG